MKKLILMMVLLSTMAFGNTKTDIVPKSAIKKFIAAISENHDIIQVVPYSDKATVQYTGWAFRNSSFTGQDIHYRTEFLVIYKPKEVKAEG